MSTKGIIGAVIGDIAGSSHEFSAARSPRFKFFDCKSTFTDDTALTMAVAEWMMDRESSELSGCLLKWGRKYPHAGYGHGFKAFLQTGEKPQVGSDHNGSAMRVSPVGFLATSLDEALALARESAWPSHDSPGGIAGAQALAAAVYMAHTGSSKEEIKAFLEDRFGFDLSRSYDDVRDEVQCALELRRRDRDAARPRLLSAVTTVQDALVAFLGGEDYESTVRLAIWLGGDSDTVGCMAGAVAAAFWGVPDELVTKALTMLPPDMIEVINRCDGTVWKPTGITPPNTHRWSPDDMVVYGCNAEGTIGEQGFFDVRPSRFVRHPNEGYAIVTIGRAIDEIENQVITLRGKASAYPERRYLVKEIGISKAGYTIEQIAPLFSWALDTENVLLPASFMEYLIGDTVLRQE